MEQDRYIDPLVAQQDQLRPLRQFVSLLSGMSGDQSYSGTDGVAINQTGQFATYGPYGQAMEGQPIMNYGSQPNGGLTISPVILLLLAGAAAMILLK